jgi:hypothetical protein
MDVFETLLLKHRNSRFLVIDPEGGYGDELILMGLEKKLRKMNIHYKLLRIRKSPFANKALAPDSVARAFNQVFQLQLLSM